MDFDICRGVGGHFVSHPKASDGQRKEISRLYGREQMDVTKMAQCIGSNAEGGWGGGNGSCTQQNTSR